jgi:methionyl-tRNA synthetase
MNPFTHPVLYPGMAGASTPLGVFIHALGPAFVPVLLGVIAWSLLWKGLAFWYSARNHQRVWFIVFLILNTAGILEILYIIFWRKNKNSVVTTTTTTHVTTAATPAPAVPTPATAPSVPPTTDDSSSTPSV